MEVLRHVRPRRGHRLARTRALRAAGRSGASRLSHAPQRPRRVACETMLARQSRGPVDTHSLRDTTVNRISPSRRAMRHFAAAAVLIVAGCATPSTSYPPRAPSPGPSSAPSSAQGGKTPLVQATWPAGTAEHVDLWLHSYALLTPDTTLVPYFRRGYRDQVVAARRQRGISTLLDTSRPKLLERINVNPSLATGPQFLPFYFASWDQLRETAELFVQRNGCAVSFVRSAYARSAASSSATLRCTPRRSWRRVSTENHVST